jgi:hypothetical protein
MEASYHAHVHRFVLLPLLLVAACTPTSTREARSLISAVDRFHKAENSEKPTASDDIEKVVCTDEEVCAAKDACVKGATPMAKALRKQRDVQMTIAKYDGAIPSSDPTAMSLPAELDEVDRLMNESKSAMTTCDDKITALRVKSH